MDKFYIFVPRGRQVRLPDVKWALSIMKHRQYQCRCLISIFFITHYYMNINHISTINEKTIIVIVKQKSNATVKLFFT